MVDAHSYRHWQIDLDAQRNAWVKLDRAGADINVLSAEVLTEFSEILADLANLRPSGVIIHSGKASGFLAGADINEFTRIETEADARGGVSRAHAVLNLLEALPFPTLALIHGHCLGGGLELALACRYRIACDAASTRIGLPEVRLGIHPGFGGSARLIRLIGAAQALPLMLSGRSVDARRAEKIGIVDHCVPQRHCKRAALAVLREQAPVKRASAIAGLANSALVRPWAARLLEQQTARKVSRSHYPAPFALIDLWRRHGGSTSEMLRHEIDSVSRLVVGPTARNLVRAYFLQERLKSGRGEKWTAPPRVHVIGAGIMGGDIAAWCAYKGCQVSLQDRAAEYIAPALKRANALFSRRIKSRSERQAAMDRLAPDVRGSGIAAADVVIEAIIEDLDAKRQLMGLVAPQLKTGAILATNTSSISLEDIADGLAEPERLIGLHFFNPVAKMPLVEVVSTAGTRASTIELAHALVLLIDRLPLPVKSSPGFLVNRVLLPYMLEAVNLVEEGVPISAVDAAARNFGMPMGPVELADTVGLDVCMAVGEVLGAHFGLDLPKRLEQHVAAGRLGRKSGRGFYEYRDGKARALPKVESPVEESEIAERLVLRMLNEAVSCLREGIVADEDLLDAGMIFGTGFAPFRGGPINYLRNQGAQKLYSRLQALEQKLGPRYTPDTGWDLFQD